MKRIIIVRRLEYMIKKDEQQLRGFRLAEFNNKFSTKIGLRRARSQRVVNMIKRKRMALAYLEENKFAGSIDFERFIKSFGFKAYPR